MSKFNKHFKLNIDDAIGYCIEKCDIFNKGAVLKAKEIGDGNINYVFKVWDKDTDQSVIIKQADKCLRTSGRPLDVDRIRIEYETLILQDKLAHGFVPKVYRYDPIMHLIVMEDISDHDNLRKALLDKKTYPTFADDITTFIINTTLPTTDLVMDSGEKKDSVKNFINKDLCKISEDLVFTEPYNDYKGRNIVLKENMEFVKKQLYEDQDLILEIGKLKNHFMNNAQSLIHGDLHTGSIFVKEDSTKILDPEFAFYGPIGYDLGNVIGNLFFAWANASIDAEENDEFISWISSTIENIITLFTHKFLIVYKELVTDLMAKEDYMNWYLQTILDDAAGYAGCEMIRRVVGDAKVKDITSIEEIEKRLQVERTLILTAKTFIMNRDMMRLGKQYVDIFNMINKKDASKN